MGRVINLLNSPIIGKKSSFAFVSLLTGLGITSLIFNYCSIDNTLPENVLPSLKKRCNKRKIGEEPDSKLSEAQTSLHFDNKDFKPI